MKMKRYDIYPWIDGTTIEKNRLYIKPRKGHIEYAAINPKGKKVTGLLSERDIGFPLSENMNMDDLKPLQRRIMKAAAKKGVVYDPVLFFIFPFATSGDRAAVPNDPQIDSTMSYAEGYTPPYEGNYPTDPAADPILRTQMNQVFYDVTNALQQYQINGFPEFITTTDNEGTPFPYDINSVVRHDPGTGVKLYISLINGNTDTPPSVNWGSLNAAITAQANLSSVQFLAAAQQIVHYDTVEYDTYSLFNSTLHRYELSLPGYYRFTSLITPAASSVGNVIWILELYRDGGNYRSLVVNTNPAGAEDSLGGSIDERLTSAHNYSISITLAGSTGGQIGAAAGAQAYRNYFSVVYIGSLN